MSKLKNSKHLKIPFKEIEIATNNFETCIGNGGYGPVYRGNLVISGKLTAVAAKRLYEQFGQGSKEFLTEISLLSGQNHKNLVSLLGFCDEGKEKIIVYEYVERGSLDQYLSRRRRYTTSTLTWPQRLNICVDIARGLDHLHNHFGKHQAIIHRDIKSSNILVDENWVAKISDLGLSKLSFTGLGRSVIFTKACGTPGYCDPEYDRSGILTKESDVYSFGVVLLEILCGRLCYEDNFMLLDYFKKKKLDEIIDPCLGKQMSPNSKDKFLEVAHGCLHGDRGQRPPIGIVVEGLEELLKSESDGFQNASPKSSFATLLKRRTNVGKIFQVVDFNKDGGLCREEFVAFLVATNVKIEHSLEQFYNLVDQVFCMYDKYLDDEKCLTYHGLLQYYVDGHGDLESDVVQLVSSDDDDSSRRHRLIAIFQKLNQGAFDGPLKLVLESKPRDNDEVTPWFGSPYSFGIILLTLLMWLISTIPMIMIMAKLRLLWFVYLILSNSIIAFMNKRKNMHDLK